MKRITRCLAVVPAALVLRASPVVAADQSVASGEPVRLSDSELDQVTAGAFLDLNLTIQDTYLYVDLNNTALNAAAVVQANVLGDSVQYAQAIAIQPSTLASW